MPLLTPELAGEERFGPLPPVLTQEMPSLTLAVSSGLAEVKPSTVLGSLPAPVLQRETPVPSPLSPQTPTAEFGEVAQTSTVKELLQLNHHWHPSPPQGGSHTEQMVTHSTADTRPQTHAGNLQETLLASQTDFEMPHRQSENRTPAEANVRGSQSSFEAAPVAQQLSLSSRPSLLDTSGTRMTSSSSHNVITHTGLSINTSNYNNNTILDHLHDDEALQHHNMDAHCSSQTLFLEPKPFSSGIWKNLNSQSPAVLIESLHPELPADFTHDSLPYTMWTEPQCKEVTDLDEPNPNQHQQDNQEGDGPLTWAQLESTSLGSTGAVEPLGLCGDFELQRGEVEAVEALALCRELGVERKAEGGPDPEPPGLPLEERRDGEEVSDMEEAESEEEEEEEEQSSAREESSSDSSSSEENEMSDYGCGDAGLEPGEVCPVSTCIDGKTDTHTHTLACIPSVPMNEYVATICHTSILAHERG